jgi:hypothetical protein
MPTCEACGQEIVWAQTVNGKLMPVDAEPTRAGNVLLGDDGPTAQPRLREATVLGARKALEARDEGRTLYKSHFASCKEADRFRRKKR